MLGLVAFVIPVRNLIELHRCTPTPLPLGR
jgi:hypothetical protein